MRKVALVFVIAVIVPSLWLAWLALGSLRDQEAALERHQTLLYQGVADSVAARIRVQVDGLRAEFQSEVAGMLRSGDTNLLSGSFDPELRSRWPVAEVGFVVALDGDVLAPSMFAGSDARRFRVENDRFLCSRESVEVYWNSPKGAISLTQLDRKEPPRSPPSGVDSGAGKAVGFRGERPEKSIPAEVLASKLAPEAAAFREIVRNGESGTLARFLQDQLNVLFWYRPPLDQPLVFGARVNLARLVEKVRPALELEPPLDNQIVLALINAAGKPVALSHPRSPPVPPGPGERSGGAESPGTLQPVASGGQPLDTPASVAASVGATPAGNVDAGQGGGGGRPFVVAEIGEVLPHWEVAAYLVDPRQLGRSASFARTTIGLLVAVLVLAIALGSWLIVADLKRQLTVARQKTDFVSNVSHELKTPLTSIRMFSEMLAEGRVGDEDKRRQFLGIITTEAGRLTRLINNVLDFAKLERSETRYKCSMIDLAALARETLELYGPQLGSAGFLVTRRMEDGPIEVQGDRDALAQVMMNLLSNAEKYSSGGKEIEVVLRRDDDGVCWSVLDRGRGVPPGCEARIFEQFFRADDSLSSGVQGSGLGLTLARHIAEAHGGSVTYRPREGGGSCFTLRLPVRNDSDAGRVVES